MDKCRELPCTLSVNFHKIKKKILKNIFSDVCLMESLTGKQMKKKQQNPFSLFHLHISFREDVFCSFFLCYRLMGMYIQILWFYFIKYQTMCIMCLWSEAHIWGLTWSYWTEWHNIFFNKQCHYGLLKFLGLWEFSIT